MPVTDASNTVSQKLPKSKPANALPPVDGLKGERERLLSRTSSMASRRPRRKSAGYLSERDEEDEDDESDAEGLAPWLTPAGKKKDKIRQSRGSRSRATTRMSRRTSSPEELKMLNDRAGSKSIDKTFGFDEIRAVDDANITDRDSSLDRNFGSVSRKDGRQSKGKKSRTGRGTVMKVPRIRLSLRRTSSAKIPKDLQERLEKIMEKERRIRSSHGKRTEKEIHPFTDSESDWDMKRHAIKIRIDPKNIVKEKQGKDRLKLPKINFQMRRRTSSAKLPKELQDKLIKDVEEKRKVKSSLGQIPKDKCYVVSETEGEGTANETDSTGGKVSKISPLIKLDIPLTHKDVKSSGDAVNIDEKQKSDDKEVANIEKVADSKAEDNSIHVAERKTQSDAVAVSQVSKSSRAGSRATSRRRHGADDTAFEDDDGLSTLESLRGGAVNRLGEQEDLILESARQDEEMVDSAVEDDALILHEIPLDLVTESHNIVESTELNKSQNEMPLESQATFDPLSRMTQQSLQSVSLENELDTEDPSLIPDKIGQDVADYTLDTNEEPLKLGDLTDEQKLQTANLRSSLKGTNLKI